MVDWVKNQGFLEIGRIKIGLQVTQNDLSGEDGGRLGLGDVTGVRVGGVRLRLQCEHFKSAASVPVVSSRPDVFESIMVPSSH